MRLLRLDWIGANALTDEGKEVSIESKPPKRICALGFNPTYLLELLEQRRCGNQPQRALYG